MANLQTVEPFDCNGDPISLGIRWENWKRAFKIFLEASDITDNTKKRAVLLHSGGIGLQEIFFNLPGASGDENSEDVFKTALEALDGYFSPKQSKIYERHVFRLMKQGETEKFDKFLVRLRHQATKCKFTNSDENLIDQITEKCSSTELRKKILSMGDAVTLDSIVLEANTLESVNRQMEKFDQREGAGSSSIDVNKIQTNSYTNRNNKLCTRCGKNNHYSSDDNCPAKNQTCHKCNKKGHFQKCCRSHKNKRASTFTSSNPPFKKTKWNKPKPNPSHEEVDYIFQIDEDDTIDCVIGGVKITMIIDSGSKSNIIDDHTWRMMKHKKIIVKNQRKNPEKKFMSYANNTPLTVLGCFDAEIKIGKQVTEATFYVIKDGKRCLLGKETAKQLAVLKVGLGINLVHEPFPKFKDITVDIPIDGKIPPVIQSYRRIPIPLEEKVDKALQLPEEGDIIEQVNEPSKWVSPIVPILKENYETGQQYRRNVVHLKKIGDQWTILKEDKEEEPSS